MKTGKRQSAFLNAALFMTPSEDYLGEMDQECSACKALHFRCEKTKNSRCFINFIFLVIRIVYVFDSSKSSQRQHPLMLAVEVDNFYLITQTKISFLQN